MWSLELFCCTLTSVQRKGRIQCSQKKNQLFWCISRNKVEIGSGLQPAYCMVIHPSCCLLKIAWGPSAHDRIRHLSLCHLCTPITSPPATVKVQLMSNIYAQQKCHRQNEPTSNIVTLTTKNILLRWTAGGQSKPRLLHVSLPSCSLLFSALRYDWPRRPPFSLLWGRSSAVTRQAEHHQMPVALFRWSLYTHHWCQVLPACRWHRPDPVRNRRSLQG